MKRATLKTLLAKHSDACIACNKCSIRKLTTTVPAIRFRFDPEANVNPLLIVGEAPGESEDAMGFPFVGRSGTLLDHLLDEAGINHFVITNAVVCTPFEDNRKRLIRTPSKEEIQNCSTLLYSLFQKLEPSAIVLLGKQAEQAFKYSNKHNGLMECPVHQALHPAFILRKGGIGSVEYKRTLLKLIGLRDAIGL